MRNVVFIHLESLNQLIYRMNKHLFPVIHEWEKRSWVFDRYYASATSTLMVLSDLMNEGACLFEECQTTRWILDKRPRHESLLDEFLKKGYSVSALAFPKLGEETESMNRNGFLGMGVRLIESDDIAEYHKNIKKTIKSGNGFVLLAYNFMNNITFNGCVKKDLSGLDRWGHALRMMDQEVKYILDLLKNESVLDNTTIVFYGDHGDDFFSHGMHGGLTHAIEPYNQLIHTPFFIYDKRIKPHHDNRLLSTADVGKIARFLAGTKEESIKADEVIICERNYVFSRNMFAAERVMPHSFEKGYSVCDGRFLLLANTKGLRMYDTEMDMLCQHDLLQYFEFCDGKLKTSQSVLERIRFHLSSIMDQATTIQIKEVFDRLYPWLISGIKEMYKKGMCSNREFEISYRSLYQEDETGNQIKLLDFTGFDLYERYFIDKRVIIYGAGKYGKYCYDRMHDKCEIICFIDQNAHEGDKYKGCSILPPNRVGDLVYDIIYIAIASAGIRQTIWNDLVCKGICQDRLI